MSIIALQVRKVDTKREFDYAAIVAPEGYQNSDSIRYFNREEVVYIFQMGFYDN